MRIVKNIAHPLYKLTLFEMNQRLSLKVENGQNEQWFKFRPGVVNASQIEESITDQFVEKVSQCFDLMAENQNLSFAQVNENEDEFDEII